MDNNNYGAEFGPAAGAVINASIRRGTNGFRGRRGSFCETSN